MMDLGIIMISEISQSEKDNREQTGGCQRGGGLGDWVKEVKGLKRTNW